MDLLALNGLPCHEALGSLTEAIQRIEANPAARGLPSLINGDRDTGMSPVDVLHWAADKCAKVPSATMTVEIREPRPTLT